MLQHLRNFLVSLGVATACAMALAVVAGTTAASAATRYRSGSVRTQLVDTNHVTSNAASASLGLTGPDVMAAIVGLMALLAFVFIVVTFIRRRVTLA